MTEASALTSWTPEQVAQGKRWLNAWAEAGAVMEQLRRDELRQLDTHKSIALLCGPADYHQPPFAPKPTSGLVGQQRWFAKVAARISWTTNQLERLKAACER
jgi:hypothetical protein